ncbi:MAG TPA: phosphoribosylglycinamide formyltransferase [Firmicutes bacterium]|nr:phosphoribosylglycinamide formyltransferase [Bacillota bacterium]
MTANLAVLASGRGTNLQAIIEAWQAGRLPVDIVGVVSDNPDAQALERARAHGLRAAVLPAAPYPDRRAYGAALVELLKSWGTDMVALAGFMRLVDPVVVRAFPNRILNIHPALLPAFPGLHAQRQALQYGVRVSGCTVHLVDEGMDTGPIVLQAAVPVLPDDTEETLAARILKEEHRLYPEAIRLLATGRLKVEGRRVYISPEEVTL